MTEVKNKCFVIMPISDTDGYKRGHWQDVYNHLIKPAVEDAGYISERADEIRSANLIAVDIIKRICEYPMAVCDLSSCNPNVFYELGIRHSMKLPVVLIKDTKTNNPFDIKDIRYVEYDEGLSVAEIPSIQEQLTATITQTNEDFQKGEGCFNSLFTLMNPNIENPHKSELPSIRYIEKIAENLCERIENTYSYSYDSNLSIEVLSFMMLCSKYDNGSILWNYVRTKYNNHPSTIVKL